MHLRTVTAAVALALATPIATWWMVGDLSETQFGDLDYLWRAPEIPANGELLVGALATAVVLGAAVLLAMALRRGEVRRQWSATVVPLCVAGALVGYGGRVVSAGGAGANIGGALMIMFAGPLVVILVVVARNARVGSRRPL